MVRLGCDLGLAERQRLQCFCHGGAETEGRHPGAAGCKLGLLYQADECRGGTRREKQRQVETAVAEGCDRLQGQPRRGTRGIQLDASDVEAGFGQFLGQVACRRAAGGVEERPLVGRQTLPDQCFQGVGIPARAFDGCEPGLARGVRRRIPDGIDRDAALSDGLREFLSSEGARDQHRLDAGEVDRIVFGRSDLEQRLEQDLDVTLRERSRDGRCILARPCNQRPHGAPLVATSAILIRTDPDLLSHAVLGPHRRPW